MFASNCITLKHQLYFLILPTCRQLWLQEQIPNSMILILREDKRFYVVKPNFKTTKGIYKPVVAVVKGVTCVCWLSRVQGIVLARVDDNKSICRAKCSCVWSAVRPLPLSHLVICIHLSRHLNRCHCNSFTVDHMTKITFHVVTTSSLILEPSASSLNSITKEVTCLLSFDGLDQIRPSTVSVPKGVWWACQESHCIHCVYKWTTRWQVWARNK